MLRIYSIVMVLFLLNSPHSKAIEQVRNYALLIGNENYEHWTPLTTPHEDISDLGQLLTDKYGFEVKLLMDASNRKIIDELETVKSSLRPSDNFLLYFAGHGMIRAEGGYWVGIDGTKTSSAGWIHYRTVSDLIDFNSGMESRHVLIVSDSCYSGSALRSPGPISATGNANRKQWLQRMALLRSRTIFTSGGTEPVLDQIGASRNSVFASALIDKLRSNEGILDGHSLFSSIKHEVHSRARRVLGMFAQSPEYGQLPGTGHLGGDFLFRPTGAPNADLLPKPDRHDQFLPTVRMSYFQLEERLRELGVPEILFETGQAKLTPSARSNLLRVAQWLIVFPDLRVDLIGYTSPREETEDRNGNELGFQRASTIRDLLVAEGVNSTHIHVSSKGSSNPIWPNNLRPDLNQRVEIYLIPIEWIE